METLPSYAPSVSKLASISRFETTRSTAEIAFYESSGTGCNRKRWQSSAMALRWTAASMLEAERQFRRIVGRADLDFAPTATHELHRHAIEESIALSVGRISQLTTTKIHGERDILPPGSGASENPAALPRKK